MGKLIAIIDYGMGNLRSVEKAFAHLGLSARITADPETLNAASHVVLPGVGAFGDAMRNIEQKNLRGAIDRALQSGKPFLGICLGMQLLFCDSLEYGRTQGLNFLPGSVKPFEARGIKIPHMGWNQLDTKENPLISGQPYVYFVHSFHAAQVPDEYVIATADYGETFPAAVRKGNVFGFQFHPEKSGEAGLDMLKRFGGLM